MQNISVKLCVYSVVLCVIITRSGTEKAQRNPEIELQYSLIINH